MPQLSDMIAAMRADLSDTQSELFGDDVARRAVERAAIVLNTDLDTAYKLIDIGGGVEALSPEPTATHGEMLLLLAEMHLASTLRAAHAEDFKFSSEDKSADLTAAYKHWSGLEASLRDRYRTLLKRLRPELDENVLALSHTPLIYESGTVAPDDVEGSC